MRIVIIVRIFSILTVLTSLHYIHKQNSDSSLDCQLLPIYKGLLFKIPHFCR